MIVLRTLWRFRLFLLVVAIGLVVDLASKEIIFERLGVEDAHIHEAYERFEQEIAEHEEYKAAGKETQDVNGVAIRPPAEPRLELRHGDPPHAVWSDDITYEDGTTARIHRIAFRATLNPGAFGGFLGGEVGVLLLLSIFSMSIVLYLLLRSSLPRYQIVGGLIIAGAIGNIYDRLTYHCVRDFFQFRWPETGVPWMDPWNVFNYADALIVGGIISLLFIEFLFPLPEAKRTAKPADDEADNSAADSEAKPAVAAAVDAPAS